MMRGKRVTCLSIFPSTSGVTDTLRSDENSVKWSLQMLHLYSPQRQHSQIGSPTRPLVSMWALELGSSYGARYTVSVPGVGMCLHRSICLNTP